MKLNELIFSLNRCYLPVVYHHNYSPNRPPNPHFTPYVIL